MALTANPRTFISTTEAALWYIRVGILVVAVAYRGKNPIVDAWEQLRIDAASVPTYFNGKPQNIGALLGISAHGTAGLTDADLDAPEALAVAPAFLPATGFVFGRASKPASHRFYFTDPPVRLQQFRDPLTKTMLVELRGLKKTNGAVGLQTVLPGSVHESGEIITFEVDHDSIPATVAPDDLVRAVHKVAAGGALARHWPASGRHDAMLALAGALARGGWAVDDALVFCRTVYTAVPSHDPAAVSRVDSEVHDSFDKVGAGKPATGFPSLTEHIDKKVVETAFGWLGIKAQSAPQIMAGAVADADWRKQLLVMEKGAIRPLLENVLLVLGNESVWAGVLTYNEFSLTAVTGRPAPWPQSRAGAVWTDFDDSQLAAWLQRYGVLVNSRIAAEAAQTIAQMNPFHPVRDYLKSLAWDGKQRVNTWLPAYLGAANNAYTCAVGGCWLISGVARIMQPGCKVDQILLLEGEQGSLKSTALRTLSGAEFFCDHISDIGSKDSRLELAGSWIFELAELDRVRRGELSRVKAFFTAQTDVFRPPMVAGRSASRAVASSVPPPTTAAR